MHGRAKRCVQDFSQEFQVTGQIGKSWCRNGVNVLCWHQFYGSGVGGCRLDLFEIGYNTLSCCFEKSNDLVGSLNGEFLD
jgi:hypothetical protein